VFGGGANFKLLYAIFFIYLLQPPSRCKIIPQHRIFEHSRPKFVSQFEGQYITPILNRSKL